MAKRKKYDVETSCPDCGGPAKTCIGCNECADCSKIRCQMECCGEVDAEIVARVAAYRLCEELMQLPTAYQRRQRKPAWLADVDRHEAAERRFWDWGLD